MAWVAAGVERVRAGKEAARAVAAMAVVKAAVTELETEPCLVDMAGDVVVEVKAEELTEGALVQILAGKAVMMVEVAVWVAQAGDWADLAMLGAWVALCAKEDDQAHGAASSSSHDQG